MISLSGLASIGDIKYFTAMGRKQVNADTTVIRLPEGFLERIDASLEDKEPRAAFFREAVERELKRRERKASK
jgi:hypothetical protein